MDQKEATKQFQLAFDENKRKGMNNQDAAANALRSFGSTDTVIPPSPPVVLNAMPDKRKVNEFCLNYENLKSLTSDIKNNDESSKRKLMSVLYEAFSHADALNDCFVQDVGKVSVDRKDILDSGNMFQLELPKIKMAFQLIIDTESEAIMNTMMNGLSSLVNQTWNTCRKWTSIESLRLFMILFQHPMLLDPDFAVILGRLCKLFYFLPSDSKGIFEKEWTDYSSSEALREFLHVLQQYITVGIYTGEPSGNIFAAASIMEILFKVNTKRKLAVVELNIDEKLYGGFAENEDFYNDVVNSDVNLRHDYQKSAMLKKHIDKHEDARYQALGKQRKDQPPRELQDFAFCEFPFLLDATSKSKILHFDTSLQIRIEHQGSNAMMEPMKFILRVHRETIVSDTMKLLERVSTKEKRKPLQVHFEGEEGIDDGGLKKEFFLVILRELLDPSYGMLVQDKETRMLWFNQSSLEATMEFELMGQLIGIAIYNGIILDLPFPSIVYKRLLNKDAVPTLLDLQQAQPQLGTGLQQLLTMNGDIEEIFQRNFQISYERFGAVQTTDLKPNGKNIMVNASNRKEYVDLYVKYVLVDSVLKQFSAFYKGFHKICGGEALNLFYPQELESVVVGCPDLDFEALQRYTTYCDAFNKTTPLIVGFWQVVHSFSVDLKKKFLKFTTGSDRVPLGGLRNLNFEIKRNGFEDTRLPTSHTWYVIFI